MWRVWSSKVRKQICARKRLREYLKAHPQEEDDEVNDDEDLQDNIKPDDSASNHGSTASSVHSKRALNIARLKGLQVQKEALEKEHQLKQRLLEQEENARREKE